MSSTSQDVAITTTVSPQGPHEHPQASLLGLPTELRLRIFTHLFATHLNEENQWTDFHLYANIYNPLPLCHRRRGNLGILRTSRQLHSEASEILYANTEINITIMGVRKPYQVPGASPIGQIEDMLLWPYVRDVALAFVLEPGRANRDLILERTHRLVKVLSRPEIFLRSLKITFASADDEALPSYFEKVIGELKALRVRSGLVRVMFAADVCDGVEDERWAQEICGRLERIIRGEREC